MGQKQIFPAEVIKNSSEQFLYETSKRNQLIYSTLLIVLIGTLLSLPFIYVDVSIRSQGILQPIQERTNVKVLLNGKIQNLYIQENQRVKAGDTLAILKTDILEGKQSFNQQQQQEKQQAIVELRQLLQNPENVSNSIGFYGREAYHLQA